MLKAVCIDIFPCIINLSNVFNYVWRHVLKDNYSLYEDNENIKPFLYNDLVSEKKSHFLAFLGNNDVAKSICDEFEAKKDSFIKKYFEEFKISESFQTFAIDANRLDSIVILIINEPMYEKYIKLIDIDHNKMILSSNYDNINYTNLESVFEKNDIALNEFIYITSDDLVVNQMKEKGFFYVKIITNQNANQEFDNKNVLNSLDDLNFGNLSFMFYDNNASGGI